MVPPLIKRGILVLLTGLFISLMAGILPVFAQDSSCGDPASACGHFRAAYDHRYTWDSSFPGYQAEVSFMVNEMQYHGRVKVMPDLSIQVLNIEDPEMRQLVEDQLTNEIIHRRRIPFETLHASSRFEFTQLDQDLVGIREEESKHPAIYVISNNRLVQVNRVLQPGDLEVSVTTLAWQETPTGVLPTWYQVIFRDSTGKILEQEDIRDSYQRLGPYYFLWRRQFRFGADQRPKVKPLPDMWFEFNSFHQL